MGGKVKLRNVHPTLKTWLRAQNTAYGMASAARTWFVDDVSGDDSYAGWDDPASAKKTIGAAIDGANAWDVIYIAPRAWTSGNLWYGTPYQEATTDLSIVYAKQGLALVGIGHQGLAGVPHGTAVTELSASTNPILKVHAPMVAIENLCFVRGGTAINSLYFYGDVAGTSEAALGSVYNCAFHYGTGSGATGDTGGALYGHAVWGLTVDQCYFMDCRVGISVKSDAATAGKFVLRNLDFTTRMTTATNISCDIYVYTQGSACVQIYNVNCGHVIPTYSGGHGRYILINADVRAGCIHNVAMGVAADTTTALTVGPAGTGILCPAGLIAVGAIYSEGAAAAWA